MCVSAKLVRDLRARNHDVLFVMEDMRGAADLVILTRAAHENRLLLSEDKDHGELIFTRVIAKPPGVVLLRIGDERAHLVLARLEAAMARFGDALHEMYVVVEEGRFRTRSLNEL